MRQIKSSRVSEPKCLHVKKLYRLQGLPHLPRCDNSPPELSRFPGTSSLSSCKRFIELVKEISENQLTQGNSGEGCLEYSRLSGGIVLEYKNFLRNGISFTKSHPNFIWCKLNHTFFNLEPDVYLCPPHSSSRLSLF